MIGNILSLLSVLCKRKHSEGVTLVQVRFVTLPVASFRGKTNYINLGSFLIKPVQRVMRYPLLLMELLGATPESHHDRPQLTEALQAVKEINVNINEYKRRKDLGKKKMYPNDQPLHGLLSHLRYLCVHSVEVQKGRRGHFHRQDLQVEHALHHQEIQPGQQPPQAPHRDFATGTLKYNRTSCSVKEERPWRQLMKCLLPHLRSKTKRSTRLRRGSDCRRDSSSLLSETFHCTYSTSG